MRAKGEGWYGGWIASGEAVYSGCKGTELLLILRRDGHVKANAVRGLLNPFFDGKAEQGVVTLQKCLVGQSDDVWAKHSRERGGRPSNAPYASVVNAGR